MTEQPIHSPRRVFVLMPFDAQFDDVYMVVRDACNDPELGPNVSCERADDIQRPGRITEQIVEAIEAADVIVADITGSNPNVMYELGYADALKVPTLILNQSVQESPFDVATMRQLLYDRARLVKDCRPRLVAGLSSIFSVTAAPDSRTLHTQTPAPTGARTDKVDLSPIAVDDTLVMEVNTLLLQLQMARKLHSDEMRPDSVKRLMDLVDRVVLHEGTEKDDLSNLAASLGNCAVELEVAQMHQTAEDLWKRVIGLVPDFAGVYFQYADFLADRGRLADAAAQLQKAKELDPDDKRLAITEVKIAMARGETSKELGDTLAERWRADTSSDPATAAYLIYLERAGDRETYEAVVTEWRAALPASDKWMADRALADLYGGLSELELAKDLYRGIQDEGDDEDRAGTAHNLAIIHHQSGEKGPAEDCWRRAYRLTPSDPKIRMSFSQFLSREQRLEEALKVSQGQPLT